jgi:hypothetical protein
MRIDSLISFCYAYRGRLYNYLETEIVIHNGNSKRFKKIRIKLDTVDPNIRSDEWKFVCQPFEILEVLSTLEFGDVVKLESIKFSSADGILYLDELIIGKTQGRVQNKFLQF